jgi:hypothetical protein
MGGDDGEPEAVDEDDKGPRGGRDSTEPGSGGSKSDSALAPMDTA